MFDRDLTSPIFGRITCWGIFHQPPDSGAQGAGARPEALASRHPHLGWFLERVRRLEEARATGSHAVRVLTPPDSVELALSLLAGVRSRSLPLVGRLHNGIVEAFCCVRGYGHRWAWRTTVSPTRRTPFPFQQSLYQRSPSIRRATRPSLRVLSTHLYSAW